MDNAEALRAAAEKMRAQEVIDDSGVDAFCIALKSKMLKSRLKGRSGWEDPSQCSVEFLAELLIGHIGKANPGNFEDIGNLAMMLHQRGAAPQVLADALRNHLTDPGYVRVPVEVAPHCDYGYITPAKGNSWFAYDPEGDGMLFFETEEEARAVAQKSVDLSLDEFWSEDVDRICYGRVTHAATQVNRSDRPESLDEEGYDEDGEYWPADCEFKCNYELLPLAAATKETSHE